MMLILILKKKKILCFHIIIYFFLFCFSYQIFINLLEKNEFYIRIFLVFFLKISILLFFIAFFFFFFFFQAEDGIRDHAQSRGLGDVYKRQVHGELNKLNQQIQKISKGTMAEQQQKKFGNGPAFKKGQKNEGRRRDEEEWKPVTKLGRLVQKEKITKIEEIFKFALPIKEYQIVDTLMKNTLKEEVMEVKSVQKQTQAGQRTRFKACAVVGDSNGHIGLGSKVGKEVQTAIKGAIISAKLNLIPVRRGYWGNKIGNAHTVPCKCSGKGGSVSIRMVPAPRGTGVVAAPVSKKVIQFAGIQDVYTQSSGKTKTRGNFVKATMDCIKNTYKILTPDFWGKPQMEEHPFEQYSRWLSQGPKQEQEEKPQRPEGKRFFRGRPRNF
eukprot:TRINITY_DN1389_c0_g1_i1.p1 TRINITY_DN1389_c0_g1~~TRINITY_DN1389_c0_g1_i1.p1  ORF type:complete len:382 (+),score=101.10 TRINITY_DN1389_c0_g1_i1:347-1492(+)